MSEKQTRSVERLDIDERQPKSMNGVKAVAAGVAVRAEGAVAADHAAEISEAIVIVMLGRFVELTSPDQLVVEREMRSTVASLFGSRHVLPTPVGQKPMVSTRNEIGAVAQRDPV